ncbi:Alcohol dehydrogenase superfamily, zinc-type [Cordyceps fumosorosea ARSEF 2679]|uniref:Alcohol dehydrogenase superfamily, zinc-type n=1 Tax=Cordyceps fumosorosea (strain ARSEF 2679) TaxID=1081104 RepID=A0A162LDR3_CORFA|nr:Alcohol dehydrogenase superfamily, zinc-type [Cordyceps fumosorosea ARSEF 2679]OAA69164.1 Alcohol dehydrogenase superfamily, zinc-type [Cordyceps fumosorosea ARSEF 2679]
MLSITAPKYTKPDGYELTHVAKPVVSQPSDVLIRVHAASINPIDLRKVDGIYKMALQDTFPYKIGYDAAGVVEEVGSGVASFKPGDEVYVRLPEASRGAWAEFALCRERFVALKPKNLPFDEAASIPLAAMTALQALREYTGSLEGKTVFIPAALSGTGAYGLQIAKHLFKVGRLITTVSTSKVSKVHQLLGINVVDQIIDYTKDDPVKAIPAGSVDFIFDTTGDATKLLPLLVKGTGLVVSVATTPSAATLQNSSVMDVPGRPRVPLAGRLFLDATDQLRKLKARCYGVEYKFLSLDPNGKDLAVLRDAVEQGQLRPVVGWRVDFKDIDKVREACWQTYNGKGGLGKTVFVVKKDS